MLPTRQNSDIPVTWVISFIYVMNEMAHPPSLAPQALQLSTQT
jgi:hypothetical protein